MNPTDYVSFATAKLLREARCRYSADNSFTPCYDFCGELHRSELDCDCPELAVPAPHLWTATKWLREEKRIMPYITHRFYSTPPAWVAMLSDIDGKVGIEQDGLWKIIKDENGVPIDKQEPFPTYEAALDAAIAEACKHILATSEKTMPRNAAKGGENAPIDATSEKTMPRKKK